MNPQPREAALGRLRVPGAARLGLRHVYCISSTTTRWRTTWIMPRISGRSALTTLSPILCSPSERSESRCALVPPIFDLVWVTFSSAISCSRSVFPGASPSDEPPCGRSVFPGARPSDEPPCGRSVARLRCSGRGGPRPEHGCRGHVLDRQAAPGGDLLRPRQALERGDCRMHHVDGVGGPERARQHVMHAGPFEHGAHRAASDDAGSGAGRLEQHDAGGVLARHRVADRAADPRHPEERLLRCFHALGDRGGYLLGLAVADADHAVAVTDHDQSGKAEPAAALHDLRDAVDGDDALKVGGALIGTAAAAVIAAVGPLPTAAAALASTAPCRGCHQNVLPSLAVLITPRVTTSDPVPSSRPA